MYSLPLSHVLSLCVLSIRRVRRQLIISIKQLTVDDVQREYTWITIYCPLNYVHLTVDVFKLWSGVRDRLTGCPRASQEILKCSVTNSTLWLTFCIIQVSGQSRQTDSNSTTSAQQARRPVTLASVLTSSTNDSEYNDRLSTAARDIGRTLC